MNMGELYLFLYYVPHWYPFSEGIYGSHSITESPIRLRQSLLGRAVVHYAVRCCQLVGREAQVLIFLRPFSLGLFY